jgi:hypothetical protein
LLHPLRRHCYNANILAIGCGNAFRHAYPRIVGNLPTERRLFDTPALFISTGYDLMPQFSARSTAVLDTTHPDLQRLMRRVVLRYDITVLPDGGKRTPERQRELVNTGKSKTLNSKHLTGRAVDVAPYPIDWDDRERFALLGGYVIGLAESMSIPLRWGGDWDGDFNMREHSFSDMPHFELLD